ncbi:MAG: universal stress protein [Ferruginibacter sp.]
MAPILAPTDFCATSRSTVKYAAVLAATLQTELVIFHAYQIPVLSIEFAEPQSFYDDLESILKRQINTMADDLRSEVDGLQVSVVLSIGNTNEALEQIASTIQPLLVVMNLRNRNASSRFFFGSTLIHALNHLQYPVLTIPDNIVFKKLENIGLAFDLMDERMDRQNNIIRKFLELFDAKLHIIHALKNKRSIEPGIVAACISLQNTFYKFKPHFYFPDEEYIEEELSRFSDDKGFDMLIVLPQHHNILKKLIFRGHMTNFVLHQTIPVLTIAPDNQ